MGLPLRLTLGALCGLVLTGSVARGEEYGPVPCECPKMGVERVHELVLKLESVDVLPANLAAEVSPQCHNVLKRMTVPSGDKIKFIVGSTPQYKTLTGFKLGSRASCRRFDVLVMIMSKDPDVPHYDALVADCNRRQVCQPLHDYTLAVINPNLDRTNYLDVRRLICTPTVKDLERDTVHLELARTSSNVNVDRDPLRISFSGSSNLSSSFFDKGVNASLSADIHKYWDRRPISHSLGGSLSLSVAGYPDPNKPSDGILKDVMPVIYSDASYTAWLTDHWGMSSSVAAAHNVPLKQNLIKGSVGPSYSVLGRIYEEQEGESIDLSTSIGFDAERNFGDKEPEYHVQSTVAASGAPVSTSFSGWEHGWRTALVQNLSLSATYTFGFQGTPSTARSSIYLDINHSGDKSLGLLGDHRMGWNASWDLQFTNQFSWGPSMSFSYDATPQQDGRQTKEVYMGTSIQYTPTNKD